MAKSGFDTPSKAKKSKPRGRKAPLWARLCAIFGCVLMVASGGVLVTSQVLVARYAGAVETQNLFGDAAAGATKEAKSDIKGPVNILLVGIDPRDTSDRAAVRLDHRRARAGEHDSRRTSSPSRATWWSTSRAFEKTGFRGGRSKINAAMSYGSEVGNGKHDVRTGLRPARQDGQPADRHPEVRRRRDHQLRRLQEDRGRDGRRHDDDRPEREVRAPAAGRQAAAAAGQLRRATTARTRTTGRRSEYKKGTYHLEGWQALDYVRQRYGLPNGDYDRQRHQQQFIKAMASQALSKDVVTNPGKLDKVLRAAGESLIFDGNGPHRGRLGPGPEEHPPGQHDADQAARPVGDHRRAVSRRGAAEHAPTSSSRRCNDGTVANFLLDHPDFINKVWQWRSPPAHRSGRPAV